MVTSFMRRMNRSACCRFVRLCGAGSHAGKTLYLLSGTICRSLCLPSRLGGLTVIPTRRPGRGSCGARVSR